MSRELILLIIAIVQLIWIIIGFYLFKKLNKNPKQQDIKIGDFYKLTYDSKDPFYTTPDFTARVLDVKDNYVHYLINEQLKSSDSIDSFLDCYTLIK